MRREQTDPRSVQLNQGIIENALDDLLYRPRFSAAGLQPGGGAVVGSIGPKGGVVLPAASATNQSARGAFMPPADFWVKGQLQVLVSWTGTAASTITNVQWNITISTATLGAAPVQSTFALVTPGPAVVNGPVQTTFSQPWAVDSSIVEIGINIGRRKDLGTDTYAGDVYIFAYRLIYIPAAGH
jgi:hypothetical protein